MDEFVKQKLTEWKLSDLIPAFEAENIDEESFFLLDANCLTSLIPHLGPRLKFQRHFAKFLENIREILSASPEGRPVVISLDGNQHISICERRCMVRTLVSHLMDQYGENPSSDTKAILASSIVDQFPCLRDSHGTGYDAWFTRGRQHRPATGFLEERLRNVRKRHQPRKKMLSAPEAPPKRSSLPEPTMSAERAIQMTEWLKNNFWPADQVVQYMRETAVYRAGWIRSSGTIPMQQIFAEFPRLLDTPGMILQDFAVLYPQSCGKLTENWNTLFSSKVIRMGKKEESGLLPEIELLPQDKQGDVALQLLPKLLHAVPYRVGRKVVRPSNLEVQQAFIDVQPIGTNMVEYLGSTATEHPRVLMLEDRYCCSQAFVVINGTALEYPSLLGAVDGCFKSFFVFDVSYPKSCIQIWDFLQTVIYEIPGNESPPIKLMRAQLEAMEE
ncbi:uncharacterized protein LOC111608572 [Xiphophorus maculatus]|uniref:uncharacterized protein LOC111608572 n=1 Tax=Xiphophorus maculatus TaxID=8083 RepID=UPI000C6DB922|nr:uncharacterized protein LOC111608572 [Xiphophorus maculatus]XP_023189228.1 uncharacterized protein LOC111608572 [Xiphophorus maculatus]XP_023189229.1 uncharacterized protein LOC111608572 [Xiphophorus maculatus]XP_023189230.1 uncharacterized protein LOC111608572 [Xiphophorus maculatus]XP_023189231.1 uncharacterized protein LOC111608572 [Xiphophorus maculatus]